MTTRVRTCNRCGFADDHIRHFQSCVPTRYWPKEMQDRKLTAMGHDLDPEREVKVKPRSLHEYRLQHPEANPLLGENVTRTETRKNILGLDVQVEVPLTVREAAGHAQCPRCHRPLLVPGMHLDCKPRAVSGASWYDAIPEAPDPEPDEEMQSFVNPQAAIEERVQAEQEAETARLEAVAFTCQTCGRVSKSAAGDKAHQRAHQRSDG